MTASPGELSSLATALGDLTRRVTAIAEEFGASKRDDVATELFHVERSLLAATRRLGKVADGL